jgi:hypothetical protein
MRQTLDEALTQIGKSEVVATRPVALRIENL